jgi:hypothetical protein
MFTFVTDRKSGVEYLANLGQCDRVEARSRGAALYYRGRRNPDRVEESIREIAKRLGVKKAGPSRRRYRR